MEGFVLLHLIKDPDKWVYCGCPHHFLARALLMWWTTLSTQPLLYKHKSCFCPSVRTQRCTAASEEASHKHLTVQLAFICWCRLRSSRLWMFFWEHSCEAFHRCMHRPWDISWSDSDTWTCVDIHHGWVLIYCCGGRNINKCILYRLQSFLKVLHRDFLRLMSATKGNLVIRARVMERTRREAFTHLSIYLCSCSASGVSKNVHATKNVAKM